MRNNRLLFLLLCIIVGGHVSAQISGANVFLQGRYVEIGEMSNGAFGASGGIPAGYHQHLGGAPGTGTNLGEVYDYGHDGWFVGAPSMMGDYSYPGYPFEGWGLQVNGGRTQAFWPGGFTSAGGGSLTGVVTGYSNVGGTCRSTWLGTASGGGMQVRQETRVDTLASCVVVTTVMVNTTGTAMPNVYYLRSTDPDNDQSWPGGGFWTSNTITYQNDLQHRVLVSAVGATGPNSYWGLGTKDCRAKCFIYNWWPMPIAVDFADMYNQTVPTTYSNYYYTGTWGGDIGIGLVYNIGTIAANDSAIVSYAYIWNQATGIDSAFPDPQIVVNTVPKISYSPPTPNYDTFNACDYPGLLSIPVDILNAEDKCWSWSKWTWSPGLGLASTTGVHNTITIAGLPASITYTITGTDSAAGMQSCNKKIFYLTILTCNGAICNSPCVGDTLHFNAPGDSMGATYKWYGPAPSTAVFATTQATFKFPASLADTGTYSVIKTVLGVADTSTCIANIWALPVATVTTSQVPCAPVVNIMSLTCSTDSVCTKFTWTGPGAYTDTVQNPVVNPFDSSMEGTYIVNVVSTHGCKSSRSVLVKPGPIADFNFVQQPGCPRDSATFNPFGASNVAAWEWNFTDGTSLLQNPLHIFNATPSGGNKYNVTLTVRSSNGCSYSKTREVDLRHSVAAAYTTNMANGILDTVCNGDPVIFLDQSTATKFGLPNMPLANWHWKYGDGSDTVLASGPSHTYANEGIYTNTLTVTDNLGCEATIWHNEVVLQPYIEAMSDSTFCLVRPLSLENLVYLIPREPFTYDGIGFSYLWNPSTFLSSDTAKVPLFDAIGTYVYTLTATLNRHQCVVQHVTTLNSVLPTKLQHMTITTTIKYGNTYQLYVDSDYVYTWTPNDGSLNNPNINNPIASPSVTTTYIAYGMDKYGCRDTASVTIRVDSTMQEHIPTGFTPNGDGLNDVFRFRGSKYQKMLEMRVYNRWGEQLFYSNNRDQGWDGTYKGVPQDLGVYYYTIILARPGYPENTVYKGEVTLIR